jgi:hypothetical protein
MCIKGSRWQTDYLPSVRSPFYRLGDYGQRVRQIMRYPVAFEGSPGKFAVIAHFVHSIEVPPRRAARSEESVFEPQICVGIEMNTCAHCGSTKNLHVNSTSASGRIPSSRSRT